MKSDSPLGRASPKLDLSLRLNVLITLLKEWIGPQFGSNLGPTGNINDK